MDGYKPPIDRALKLVLEDDRPLKIINAPENISAAIMRLQAFENRFLYVVKYLDADISNYLNESQEAINFYYNVEKEVLELRFLCNYLYYSCITIIIYINYNCYKIFIEIFRSINNLILASSIGQGNLDTKVPEIKTDKDMEILNKNFNLMISKLKDQQEKLIINERYEAWGNLARKLAHEIKNPLTPIQLTLDRIKSKYSDKILKEDQLNFEENLKIINNQIKQLKI